MISGLVSAEIIWGNLRMFPMLFAIMQNEWRHLGLHCLSFGPENPVSDLRTGGHWSRLGQAWPPKVPCFQGHQSQMLHDVKFSFPAKSIVRRMMCNLNVLGCMWQYLKTYVFNYMSCILPAITFLFVLNHLWLGRSLHCLRSFFLKMFWLFRR